MIKWEDEETQKNLTWLLRGPKLASRLTLWVGAGVSSWCGFPRWSEFAERVVKAFGSFSAGFELGRARQLLEDGNLPGVFQLCSSLDRRLYRRLLLDTFSNPSPTAVFSRFVRAIDRLKTRCILTTNIDLSLETATSLSWFSGQEMERARLALQDSGSFIVKLHGSISDLSSVVFTEEDYKAIVSLPAYSTVLREILSSATILFVGYGLRDSYLIEYLQNLETESELLGIGPHFAFLPEGGTSNVPSSVRVIRYVPSARRDHREVLALLEEVGWVASAGAEGVGRLAGPNAAPRSPSRHLIFDLYPPGTWTTSRTLEVASSGGGKKQLLVGPGFSQDEAPPISTALHDLVVGLVCFEEVLLTLDSIGKVHALVGSELFERLISEGLLRFVYSESQEALIYSEGEAVGGGDLGILSPSILTSLPRPRRNSFGRRSSRSLEESWRRSVSLTRSSATRRFSAQACFRRSATKRGRCYFDPP